MRSNVSVPEGKSADYRVLARKYRPTTFALLIGQSAMVRTLGNAIASGRLAQAFILAGVRGVGKTTTARLIARALNCVGPDGKGGPTMAPCGVCAQCQAIADDRHPDVIEMDAASRTGVDNIRDLIDGVRYAPVQARYKIYILDEVHMLSEKAFNALLKTLEEPPPHVKFVFCTTEARKVPVTVLSRCQRFDLRRVDASALVAHLSEIAAAEGAEIEAEALTLIARAAEGSVRDALSLLDQAIAHADGKANRAEVQEMLGLADRGQVFDLLECLLKGDVAHALGLMRTSHANGADPMAVIRDLLELSHWITRIKITPAAAEDALMSEDDRRRGVAMAGQMDLPGLSRLWQMLLKSLGEIQLAPDPLAAAEMGLIRIGYAADLPAPAELIRNLQLDNAGGHSGGDAPPNIGGRAEGRSALAASPTRSADLPATSLKPASSHPGGGSGGGASPARRSAPEPDLNSPPGANSWAAPLASIAAAPSEAVHAQPADFRAVTELFGEKRELLLQAHLFNDVELVHFEEGRIEICPRPNAPKRLAGEVAEKLRLWTGRRWIVSLANQAGGVSLAEQDRESNNRRKSDASSHPLVRAALAAFPGAELVAIRGMAPAPPSAEDESADGGGPIADQGLIDDNESPDTESSVDE
jgi:DNA polymerase-3 subunit gamma/tau